MAVVVAAMRQHAAFARVSAQPIMGTGRAQRRFGAGGQPARQAAQPDVRDGFEVGARCAHDVPAAAGAVAGAQRAKCPLFHHGQVAQLVEHVTEKPLC